MSSEFLRKQHEEQRLRHAIDYVGGEAKGSKKLTSSELARLNRIITAGADTTWRTEPVTIKIPSGKVQQFSVISNSIEDARRILGQSYDLAHNGDLENAVIGAYLQLIQEHLFEEANRRTAALAVLWLLNEHDRDIDTFELLNIPVGDVRDPKERAVLSAKIKNLIK